MKNWKLIAEGLDGGLSAADIKKIAPLLDGLEAAFRPLADGLPIGMEPAVVFDPETEPIHDNL